MWMVVVAGAPRPLPVPPPAPPGARLGPRRRFLSSLYRLCLKWFVCIHFLIGIYHVINCFILSIHVKPIFVVVSYMCVLVCSFRSARPQGRLELSRPRGACWLANRPIYMYIYIHTYIHIYIYI